MVITITMNNSNNFTPTNEHPTESVVATPEKKVSSFTDRQKLFALMASIAVLGGGVVFLNNSDKNSPNPETTPINPTEQTTSQISIDTPETTTPETAPVNVTEMEQKSKLDLKLAPEEMYLSVDGKEKQSIKNGQGLKIISGKHSLEFSQNEFDSITKEVDADDKQTTEVIVVLDPQTSAAKKLLLTPGADKVVQRFTSEQMTREVDQLEKDYPILSILPIQARLYIIGTCK